MLLKDTLEYKGLSLLRRVREIETYVNTRDACFPTSIILAVPGVCANMKEKRKSDVFKKSILDPRAGDDPT